MGRCLQRPKQLRLRLHSNTRADARADDITSTDDIAGALTATDNLSAPSNIALSATDNIAGALSATDELATGTNQGAC